MDINKRKEFIDAINGALDIKEKDVELLYTDEELKITVLNVIKFYENLYQVYYKKDMPKAWLRSKGFVIIHYDDPDYRKDIVKIFVKMQKELKKLKGYLRRMRG